MTDKDDCLYELIRNHSKSIHLNQDYNLYYMQWSKAIFILICLVIIFTSQFNIYTIILIPIIYHHKQSI